jgi:hypothetical protein
MKTTFTVSIDEQMDQTLENLKRAFRRTSKADVFRMGIALLHIANEAMDKGQKLVIADREDKVVKEILIPR